MKTLFSSLAFRLSLAIAFILLLAFFALVMVYQQSIQLEFHDYVAFDDHAPANEAVEFDQIARDVTASYESGGWNLARTTVAEQPFLLIATDGKVMAGAFAEGGIGKLEQSGDGSYMINISFGKGNESQIRLAGVKGERLETSAGLVFAHLLYVPTPETIEPSKGFAGSVFLKAAWLIIPISLITLVLVALSVRYGLSPIHQLTHAAKKLQGGTIPAPVTASASGEVADLINAFNSAVEELARTDSMRKQFIAGVAHELRTPVTNVKAQMEAVEAGLIKADSQFIHVMKGEISLLENLINDLQDLANSDAGQLNIYPEALKLRTELEDAWNGFLGSRSAEFDNRVDAELMVLADPRRLRQILLNLFSNAYHARQTGLVITSSAALKGQMIEISISDNGPGIESTHLVQIFQRFYRVDPSRSRDTGGAGLGLSIVQTLVQAHGGKISAENLSAGGASFKFSLPSSN